MVSIELSCGGSSLCGVTDTVRQATRICDSNFDNGRTVAGATALAAAKFPNSDSVLVLRYVDAECTGNPIGNIDAVKLGSCLTTSSESFRFQFVGDDLCRLSHSTDYSCIDMTGVSPTSKTGDCNNGMRTILITPQILATLSASENVRSASNAVLVVSASNNILSVSNAAVSASNAAFASSASNFVYSSSLAAIRASISSNVTSTPTATFNTVVAGSGKFAPSLSLLLLIALL